MQRNIRLRNIGGVAGVFALVVFLYAWQSDVTEAQAPAATWRDNGQCAMPSGSTACQVGAPINLSSTTETKTGPLKFKNGLTVSNPVAGTCNGDSSVLCAGSTADAANKVCVNSNAGSVCLADANLKVEGPFTWNGVAITYWRDVTGATGTFVPLHFGAYDDPTFDPKWDVGYVSIKGPAATSGRSSTFRVKAGIPSVDPPVPTTAVTASTSVDPATPQSYAIVARAGAAGDQNMAFYGYTPTGAKNAWAGYFRGDVVVKATGAGGKKWDFIIGGTAAPNDNNVAELCLSDVCVSSWPTDLAGDDLWFDTSGYLQVKDPTWNLAVGGDSSSAPFVVEPVPAQSVTNLVDRGEGRSSTLVIQ